MGEWHCPLYSLSVAGGLGRGCGAVNNIEKLSIAKTIWNMSVTKRQLPKGTNCHEVRNVIQAILATR